MISRGLFNPYYPMILFLVALKYLVQCSQGDLIINQFAQYRQLWQEQEIKAELPDLMLNHSPFIWLLFTSVSSTVMRGNLEHELTSRVERPLDFCGVQSISKETKLSRCISWYRVSLWIALFLYFPLILGMYYTGELEQVNRPHQSALWFPCQSSSSTVLAWFISTARTFFHISTSSLNIQKEGDSPIFCAEVNT